MAEVKLFVKFLVPGKLFDLLISGGVWGILTYMHLTISLGIKFMIQQQFHRCLRSYSQKLFLASSVMLGLLIPSVAHLPGSRVLAQNMMTQDLEAAGLYQQGVIRYGRTDFQGAEMLLRQALLIDPNLAAARTYLGNIMLQQNRLDAAVQEYSEAVRIDPNFAEGYFNLGLGLQKQGQQEAAITAYRQALTINPTMVGAYYNMGLALYEQGRFADAIASYQQAISLDDRNPNAYFNLAIALQQQGQNQAAMNAYRQVVQINPNSAAAYNSLGNLMIMQGQTADAIATYQESVRRIPKNPEAYYSLGTTWYNQGEIKKANIAFQRAQKQYREQGNYQQAEKIEQLIQQIAQGNRNPQETLPTSQTPPETPQAPIQSNNSTEVSPNNMIEFGQPIPGKS